VRDQEHPVLTVTWGQALAWRMRRHLLDPLGRLSTVDVVERLGGVQAQVASAAELAVALRSEHPAAGAAARALEEGRIIRTWAMRGALHLLEPRQGAALLALIAHARPWERPSWQRAFDMTPARMAALREAVALALQGTTLTREELIRAVVTRPGLRGAEAGLRSGWGTLLKPLAWQGELCYGPMRGQNVTFMRPADASPAWSGLPDPDEAAATAIDAYLGTHGPATVERFGTWMSGGYFGRRQIRAWFADQGDRLAQVSIEGREAWLRAQDVAELEATEPTTVVRLLPGFDQWVLGPGTADGKVVPQERRSLVSRQGGWISPVVVSGGVVSGTWELRGDSVAVAWFRESGRPPKALAAEVVRLGGIVGRELRMDVEQVVP
jgi:hypothetical protein